MAVQFFVGTHQVHWLGTWPVPLFVSRRRLTERVQLPKALAPWALDSGGFTELDRFGKWTITAEEYASEARKYQQHVGRMRWAAIQDWMCEPWILKSTAYAEGEIQPDMARLVDLVGLDGLHGPLPNGDEVQITEIPRQLELKACPDLTREQQAARIREHQRRTIQSFLDLRSLAPEIPWAPVLQGWMKPDYLAHLDMYTAAGVDLTREPIVGVGSVCRRQHSAQAVRIFQALHAEGLNLHGFGLKLKGLELSAQYLTSADSMAWSFSARREAPLAGCSGHKNCANCIRYAQLWRGKVMRVLAQPESYPSDFLSRLQFS